MDIDWVAKCLGVASAWFLALGWLLKYVITKWLDNKFESRIQKMQHDNELQLKKIEVQLNAKLDRETKINQKDFEVIPEMWVKISESFRMVNELRFSFQQQPDLNTRNDLEVRNIIGCYGMSQSEQDEILNSTDKNVSFSLWKDRNRSIEADAAYRDSVLYLTRNSIILGAELKMKLLALHRLMRAAITEYNNDRFMKLGGSDFEKASILNGDGKIILDEIESVMARMIRCSS